MFWLVGGNQVGKAAITGWRDLITPAVERDPALSLWPFDGRLAALLARPGVVIAETYPGPYTRSAALSRTAPPSELGCWRSNVATIGLSQRSGKRTVCGIVCGVTQGPPWWVNGCVHSVYTTRGSLFLYCNPPFLNNPG